MRRNLVLFSLILLLGATAALAQVDFRVTSLPRTVRGEGRTEAVGNVVMRAQAAGTILAGSTIFVTYDGTITNEPNVNNLACGFGAGQATPSTAQCTAAGITASFTGNVLTIGFGANVPIVNGDLLNVFGVRLDVFAVGTGLTSINATLSGSSPAAGSNPITFTDAIRPIATVIRPSYSADGPFVSALGTGARISPVSVQTCIVIAPNTTLATLGDNVPGSFSIAVVETFPSAFTSTADEQALTPGTRVNNGSRIEITLFGIPRGFTVTHRGFAGSSASLAVVRNSGIDPGTQVTATSADASIVIRFNATNPAAIETAVVNFQISHTDSVAVPAGGVSGPITARVRLSPIDAFNTDLGQPDLRTIVSFGPNEFPTRPIVAVIGDCISALLFPFVASNVASFDTGIAIANTTADDAVYGNTLGIAAVGGTCRLVGLPKFAAGATTGPAAVTFTTGRIEAGDTYTAIMSSTAGFNGFVGHMYAICGFPGAHGFTFLVDNLQPAGAKVAEGYLPLVMPSTRLSLLGESLAH